MAEKTALAKVETGNSLVEYNAEELEVIKKHLAPNCGDVELRFLIASSRANGMNVIKKDCHFVPRRQWDTHAQGYVTKWVVVTSIDFYRKRGMAWGNIDWHESKPYYIAKVGTQLQEFEWRNLPGLGFPPYPMYARAKIKRKDMGQAIEHTVYWNEYAPIKDGKPIAMWASMPGNQLSKCAEAGCWRKAVPELAGVYVGDELRDDNARPIPRAEVPPPALSAPVEPPPPPPPAPAPTEPASLVNSLFLELSQCNSSDEISRFSEVRVKEIASLATQDRDAVRNAMTQREREIGQAQPPESSAPLPPPPDATPPPRPAPEPQTPADTVSEQARKDAAADAPKKKHATDSMKRLVMKICYALEDEKGKSFISNNDSCEAFVRWLFKVKGVKDILLDDTARFIAKFNNFKDQKTLFDLYAQYRNETDVKLPQG